MAFDTIKILISLSHDDDDNKDDLELEVCFPKLKCGTAIFWCFKGRDEELLSLSVSEFWRLFPLDVVSQYALCFFKCRRNVVGLFSLLEHSGQVNLLSHLLI